MPSFVKTLLRWYLTVRGLMNSRAPISALNSRFWPAARLGLLRGQRLADPGGAGGPRGALAGRPGGGRQLAAGPFGGTDHRDCQRHPSTTDGAGSPLNGEWLRRHGSNTTSRLVRLAAGRPLAAQTVTGSITE
jgi:hypothetical protein